MMLRSLVLVGILFAIWVGTARAEEDVTPPTLVSVSIAPTVIDTDTGDVTIEVTLHITDDLSGVRQELVFLTPIATIDDVGPRVILFGGRECGDDPVDITCIVRIEVPQYSMMGHWGIYKIELKDAVGNRVVYAHQQAVWYWNSDLEPQACLCDAYDYICLPPILDARFVNIPGGTLPSPALWLPLAISKPAVNQACPYP